MSHLPEKIIVFSFGTLLLVNVAFKLVLRQQEQKVLGLKTQQELLDRSLAEQQSYWLEVVAKNPEYRDGYLKLAEIAWQQNKNLDAKKWVARALEIDPNYLLPTPLLYLQN